MSGTNIYARRVKDVMSREIVTLEADATIHEALILMGENRVSALPVVNGDHSCIGILSTADLVDVTRDVDDDLYHLDRVDPTSRRYLLEKLAHNMGNEPVQSFMSETVTTINWQSTICTATREFLKKGIHHLPVIDEKDRLVGIISTMDILAEFAEAAPV